eukprot:12270433-Alexandrium_andersonii.AAC.1
MQLRGCPTLVAAVSGTRGQFRPLSGAFGVLSGGFGRSLKLPGSVPTAPETARERSKLPETAPS